MTLDPRFERRVIAEMARLERAANRRPRRRRNGVGPQEDDQQRELREPSTQIPELTRPVRPAR